MDLDSLKSKFCQIYGGEGEVSFFHSPGRVNLIGEHTDYNGGYVFPCALSFGTLAAARKRDDRVIKLASANFPLRVEVNVGEIRYDEKNGWGNYLLGVVREFEKLNLQPGGLEILIDGGIPNGAGLSSSASIELLMSFVLNDFFGFGLDAVEMARLSQRAENQFVGMNCGIMDQFAVAKGKKDMAILLDCMSLNYEYIPVRLHGYKIIIANTNKRRGLSDSKYNERRRECEQALAALNKKLDLDFLCDMDVAAFEEYKNLIEDLTARKRAEHVVYENARVLKAADYLRAGEIEGFGRLLNESHASLRDLYEVTGAELDALAEEAWKIEGVAGARITGAGFGGCTVNIVKQTAVEGFIAEVGRGYHSRTGLTADFYIADIGDGARKITI